MKPVLATLFVAALTIQQSCGQVAGQALKRARDLNDQNNVRQGVAPPSQNVPHPPSAGNPTNSAASRSPGVSQAQSLTKLTTDIAGFKTASTATPEQKQQFTITLANAARGTKPTLGTVKKSVDSLTGALTQATLTSEHQSRLAQNIEAVLNSKLVTATQFEKIIADIKAILVVGGVKGALAAEVAGDLKAVGNEVRR